MYFRAQERMAQSRTDFESELVQICSIPVRSRQTPGRQSAPQTVWQIESEKGELGRSGKDRLAKSLTGRQSANRWPTKKLKKIVWDI